MQENSALENENNIKSSTKKPILSTKSKKIGKVFYKVFSSFLVLILVCVPLFTFTACVDNGTIYVGIMSKRASNIGDEGATTPANMFLTYTNNISRNILTALAGQFGVYEINANNIDVPFEDYLNISYDVSLDDIEKFYQEFSLFNYCTYLEYSNATVQRKVLVISNQELNKSFIEDNIVSFDSETGTFKCAMDRALLANEDFYQVSGAQKGPELREGDEMPINNVYRCYDGGGLFEDSLYSYVFIGNQIGQYSFSNASSARTFIQKLYNTNYALIEHMVYVPSINVNQPTGFRVYNWNYSRISSGISLDQFYSNPNTYANIFTTYYYKDVGVFICRYLVTNGNLDPEALREIKMSSENSTGTLYDAYLEAADDLGKGGELGTSTDDRELFIEQCAYYLSIAGIPSDEDSEGEVLTRTASALFSEMLSNNYISVLNSLNIYDSVCSEFRNIISENGSLPDTDYSYEASSVFMYDYFAYKEKNSLDSMERYDSIMLPDDYEPIQAIIFQSWEMSDTLDAILINFEYYRKGETDAETEANKEAAWAILQNYTFSIRYSVIPEAGAEQIAQNIVLDDTYVNQKDLEDGLIFLDLQSIFNNHFKEKFANYSSDGFYLRDFSVSQESGILEPFADNFYFNTINGSAGVGSYYNGMMRDSTLPEYYVEIIFGAPSYSQILDFKIVDIFL